MQNKQELLERITSLKYMYFSAVLNPQGIPSKGVNIYNWAKQLESEGLITIERNERNNNIFKFSIIEL